jgi:hypothetical protein
VQTHGADGVVSERSRSTLHELQLQSRKLDVLQSSADSFHATLREELRTTKNLVLGGNEMVIASVKTELSRLPRQLPEEKLLMSHLENQRIEVDHYTADTSEHGSSYAIGDFGDLDTEHDTQLVVSCKFVSFKLPLGVLTIRKVSTTALQNWSSEAYGRTAYHKTQFEFSLFPASWLTKTVVQLCYQTKKNSGADIPDTGWKLRQRHYNTNKALPALLNRGDVRGIKEMFRRNEATPHDLLAP